MFLWCKFCVRKSQILVHPKMFYERIIQFVNYNQNPEEGHYFERLWYSMFAERKGKNRKERYQKENRRERKINDKKKK